MTSLWTVPQALIHMCFGDELLTADARNDSARRLAFRFRWLRSSGQGRKVSMEIEEAFERLFALIKSGAIEASALIDEPDGTSTPRRRIDPRSLTGYEFGPLEAAGGVTLAPITVERSRRSIFKSVLLRADPIVECFPNRKAAPGDLSPYPTLEQIASKGTLALQDSLRYIASFLGDDGGDIAAVISGPTWAMSDSALKRLARTDKAWADRAVRVRAEAMAELISWLQAGRIVASSQRGEIPANEWTRIGNPDWWRNQLGPVDDPSRYSDILLPRNRLEELARQQSAMTTAMASETDRYQTGLRGPRTGFAFVRDEHLRRMDASEAFASVKAEARHLKDWFDKAHPNAPPLSAKSIENKIREQHRSRAAPGKPQDK